MAGESPVQVQMWQGEPWDSGAAHSRQFFQHFEALKAHTNEAIASPREGQAELSSAQHARHRCASDSDAGACEAVL